jgi:hypothetical protein
MSVSLMYTDLVIYNLEMISVVFFYFLLHTHLLLRPYITSLFLGRIYC